jgi:hypothetical protein
MATRIIVFRDNLNIKRGVIVMSNACYKCSIKDNCPFPINSDLRNSCSGVHPPDPAKMTPRPKTDNCDKRKPINFSEWFSAYDLDHIIAFDDYLKTGKWYNGFLPDNLIKPVVHNILAMEAAVILAKAWIAQAKKDNHYVETEE